MLDNMDQTNATFSLQIQKLEQRISTLQLPSDLLEKIKNMILLLKVGLSDNQTSFVNYENVVTYVNWIASLPFNQLSKDTTDLKLVKEILDKNHYGLDSVKDRILEYLSSMILNIKTGNEGFMNAPILCLVGLVGTGKTSLSSSIAQALGRKFERVPFGGMGDARALRGQSRVFSDAEPGSIIKKLAHAQSKNCVILLDELDRVSDSARADVMGVLVELLDPEQNKSFVDHYIDYPFDLSKVLFIATVNNTTNVATAVLDRLEIIQMPSYSDQEKIFIAKNYLLPKIKSQSGLAEDQISIDDSLWPLIIRPLGFDSGIRSLERAIESMCRKAARLIVEGKSQSVKINNDTLTQFLPV